MSNFAFLKAEWLELHDAATKAEGLAYPDARAACFYTLLTEGGDPDKLGRGTLWKGELSECIHQNHVFRVRLTSA